MLKQSKLSGLKGTGITVNVTVSRSTPTIAHDLLSRSTPIDGRTVHTNIANSNRERFTLAPSNGTTTAGAWAALGANSGQVLWSAANPSTEAAQGPVTIANDVLFAGSVASYGPIYAMDAKTGNILWSYNTSATVYGGVSASIYRCIYLGNGYTVGTARLFHPTWIGGTSLYAFCVA
ncbi:unnamed protein product [Dovyalis caffra]|uniref:Pyrrolo-quinoline quinone repeat domain-containing protein n=1 Tax=Dovyalis caffra TaxID=77055 RepID=A0AAV1S380_9ROSI|nr:unnamed protein product [Dovyalis caffra]